MSDSDAFTLGKIEATVTGTAEDVKAIRTDMGDHARRIALLERWQAAYEGSRKGVGTTMHIIYIVLAIFIALGSLYVGERGIVGHILSAPESHGN